MQPTIALSINTSWNIVNFRAGLIRRLQAEGFGIVAIAPTDEWSARLLELGVRHIPIAMENAGTSPVRDAKLLRDYHRILRQLRPAAFLGWTIKPNVYGSLAAHALGIPVINNVSGLGTAFIKQGLLTRLVKLLYRAAFARSATVFFQNPLDRALFVDAGLVKASAALLLPGSGIDTDRFSPGPPRAPNAPFTFLMVARVLRDKGAAEYAEAAGMVRARWPAVRCQLLGFLDSVNRTAIGRAELDGWVAAGKIDYLGEAEDVRSAIADADCVVLPSYREGMPRSLLEGAAMGKPLIATRVPGCIEIAREGDNALLCEVRDPRSLADAMARMVALPPAERDAMGRRGREIAVTEFAEGIVVDRYLDALRAALATA